MQGGDFSEKGGYTKPPQPNFTHMKEGAEMHMQTFICSTVYQWGDRKEEHANGSNGCFQDPGTSSNDMLSNTGVRIKDVAAISPLFSIS